MKKYIIPILFFFLDIAIYSFQPELTGIRLGIQYFVFFSLFVILIKKTMNTNTASFVITLKWSLCIGLILPILLSKNDLLFFDQIYLADILIPILFYELLKSDSNENMTLKNQKNG